MMKPDEIADLVHYVEAAVTPYFGAIPSSVLQEVVRDFVHFSGRTRPLHRDETGIVTLLKPKTAALCADRVWLQYAGNDTKLDFAFGWTCPIAVRLAAIHAFLIATGNDSPPKEPSIEFTQEVAKFISTTERDLSRAYASMTGASVMPLYDSASKRDTDYRFGNYPVIITVVENIAVVSEESLTWDAVIDFRKDRDSQIAYRRFIHWLDKEMGWT